MERNFFRRIEVCFPIERKQHRERIIDELETYLSDNLQAWRLGSDGAYERLQPHDAAPVNAQERLLMRYSSAAD
jgi:polyphosphate kinase